MGLVTMVVHPERREAPPPPGQAMSWLVERGHQVRLPIPDAAAIGHPELGVPEADLEGPAELALSVGGDGTVLRTVQLVAAAGVPVLSVNVGQLGYLTEVDP